MSFCFTWKIWREEFNNSNNNCNNNNNNNNNIKKILLLLLMIIKTLLLLLIIDTYFTAVFPVKQVQSAYLHMYTNEWNWQAVCFTKPSCTLYLSHARWSYRRRSTRVSVVVCLLSVWRQLFERNYFSLLVDCTKPTKI